MARESYIVEKSPGKVEELNIHAMTTRQLRQYISDKATEAQSRIDSANMKTASKAFKDAASDITFKGTDKVMRSTSYMTKSEMRQFAYDLRQFNSLDQTSGFAKSIDWRENKKAYESFIKKQIELDKKSPWSKYKLPSGNISKKGFDEYKQFIRFLNEMNDIKNQYGYETLKVYFEQADKSENPKERRAFIMSLLWNIYEDNKEEGLTSDKLNKKFKEALKDHDEEIRKAQTEKKTQAKRKQTARKVPASSKKVSQKADKAPTVKIKKARKLRTHGQVRKKRN
jgi:hypothetical protein